MSGSRTTSAARSEADVEQIMENLTELEVCKHLYVTAFIICSGYARIVYFLRRRTRRFERTPSFHPWCWTTGSGSCVSSTRTAWCATLKQNTQNVRTSTFGRNKRKTSSRRSFCCIQKTSSSSRRSSNARFVSSLLPRLAHAILLKANINWAPVHLTERAGLREILLLVEEDWKLQTTRQEAEQRSKEAHWQQGSYTIYMYVIIAIVVTSQHVYVSPMTSLADDRHVERSHSSSSAQPPATGNGEKGGWRGRASRRRVSLNLPIPLFCLRQKD